MPSISSWEAMKPQHKPLCTPELLEPGVSSGCHCWIPRRNLIDGRFCTVGEFISSHVNALMPKRSFAHSAACPTDTALRGCVPFTLSPPITHPRSLARLTHCQSLLRWRIVVKSEGQTQKVKPHTEVSLSVPNASVNTILLFRFPTPLSASSRRSCV